MLLAVGASWTHWLARPHVFSFLLLVLWNGALRQYEVTGHARRLALTLVALMVCWVNLHGASLCVVASFANPNGWRLLAHNLWFLRSEFLLNYLREYASPDFHSAEARGFLLWLAAILGTLALVRPKLPARPGTGAS